MDLSEIKIRSKNREHKDTYDKEDVISSAERRIEDLISNLYPNGKIISGKFYIGNIEGSSGDSMEIEIKPGKAGKWFDHATGEGGDIISLWKQAKGISDFSEAVNNLGSYLNIMPQAKIRRGGKRKNNTRRQQLPEPSARYDYTDKEGVNTLSVLRYDLPDGSKQFRPFDHTTKQWKAPTENRPLYNLTGVTQSETVVFCEGEKCVDALIFEGYCATTAMNGAKSPIDKTDFSPLAGKDIRIWPDNDEPGKEYAKKIKQVCDEIGAKARVLEIPENKPKKWDAADASEEGENIDKIINSGQPKPGLFDFDAWSASNLTGEPPERKYLVDGLFPMGAASLLAAAGDSGKGMLMLDLAIKVACGRLALTAFGNHILESGRVFVFSAEDDSGEIHRRIHNLHGAENVGSLEKLHVIPLTSAGGPFPIIETHKGALRESEIFKKLKEKILNYDDIKLIIFDPLASFVHADINSDPAAGSFLTGIIASFAHETGAAVILPHHMAKTSNRKVTTAADARNLIRGTTALVDGVRFCYVLWAATPEDVKKRHSKAKGVNESGRFFFGATAKSNGPADKKIKLFERNYDNGLLEEVALTGNSHNDSAFLDLIKSVEKEALRGKPFTHTGANGVYKQRHRLPKWTHDISQRELERMVTKLLNDQRIIKGMAQGSKAMQWLDIPTGPFAIGVGEFIEGA